MATIVTIQATDQITNSRADINTNFANLNSDKIETSVIDTDTTLAANSDAKIPSQKAVKAYVDAGGNVNASTTAKGIVEEATQTEVDAGTAAGGTGARLFVNPSTLPVALTVMPMPAFGIDFTQPKLNKAVNDDTNMHVGQIVIPYRITVNKISIYTISVSVAGTLDLSLYTEDGQTRLFSVTTDTISGAGVSTVSVSSVAIKPGIYYFAVNPNSTANITIQSWYSNTNELATTALNGGVSGEPVMQGTLAITGGTPPTTITPASITAQTTGAMVCRLDN